MQLPSPICIYQELNYTIIVDDVNVSIAVELGPFHHISHSTIIKESITKGLVRDTEYAVRVIITTFHLVVKSDSHALVRAFILEFIVFSVCTALGWAVRNFNFHKQPTKKIMYGGGEGGAN